MLPPSSAPPPSDSQLLLELRAGEAKAFEAFVRRFCNPFFYVAKRILRNEEDTRDAVQEAFLLAFRALPQFDGRSQLSTWVHRIVLNVALKKYRTQQRHPEQSIESLLPHFVEDEHHEVGPQFFQSSVEAWVSREEQRAIIHEKINQLPESYRTVILLRDIEGLNTEETAELLEISTMLVKTRLHRARQALRTLLEPLFRKEQS
ncbi:rna polymerase sigma factor : RNA polymerase sigma factor, sigma-70 family OS=Planctomyces limnophilus (strain ATCC 43296 / DSM 3776 / IFAM 1008 / 290) GN=Plim_3811 PE=4 SV=1: Sigma70_r2: Sigma70_r4_2 [Tuwongella immobilis]|uniref:RNA polymerase subunit sigma-24 n=2 Tax=Tuwongella immobilis TaxID=692036 RepID=A0A6C2YJQ2_9BACT|nr:rna polymerase sigma factor : RNA polymerase sigma factor, sigma-70 family OS=Planctomyces limnophilus (strain ATCC 43296 / DSM 3776 / IFAM 1008 / 290) GN=Plim_3811 PE=4 SV=1: Sigma70_r2: Sigma70_r4_2 [Tuwongella immobilis]VTR98910.1 rna polymerase sigma factor : RNA polymerase sigma factor, sigma-70 family OS=Planctomyces limnophilus (strain ATCC 43296 / DSM 3776 / IFAM 1008 / 290) GN=Plim_3811 PE=4 SV=1: Sigma70_r2: Sigma70_r4_2 [Tuwongella immobilis]